ncbi:FUSC family protein [Paraclostridium bifermentans]|uniref:FUSC family protein n=1 Tax=Paraclostridium bifermentans TaxID=1490 RepID=UPI0018A9A047|nr:FUSC family protein [Paraclostridium bifermentans]
MKKQLMNIAVFLIAIISIMSFYMFGKDNVLIGIGSITIAITMLRENHTNNIPSTFLKLSVAQIIIGCCAYIANYNSIYIVITTFVLSFSVYYIGSSEIKGSKSNAFMMLYILLLYAPVSIEQMPKRILALVFSAIIILFLYFVFTRYNFKKITDKKLNETIQLITTQLNLIKEDKPIEDENKNVNILLKNLELDLYDSIEKSNKIKKDIYNKQIIVILLKKINTGLNYIESNSYSEDLFRNLNYVLEDISSYILGDINLSELKNNFCKYDESTNIKNMDESIDKYNYYSLRIAIKELYNCLDNKQRIESIEKKTKIRKILKNDINRLTNNFSMESLRFNLAIKASILISIAVFVVDYFNIYEGKWVVYTLAVVLLPYAEDSTKKSIDRVIGTILGAIMLGIIYKLINGNQMLMIFIFMISLYLNISIKKYNIRCIFITMTAITAVKLIYPNTTIFMLLKYRVILILFASMSTVIITNLVFPYKINNDMKSTINSYINFNKEIFSFISSEGIGEIEIEKVIIKNNYYWMRLNFINNKLKEENIEEFLKKQNDFFTNLSFSILLSGGIANEVELIKNLYKEFKATIYEDESLYEFYKSFFNSRKSDLEKSIMISLYRIYLDMREISFLGDSIIKD